MKNDSDRQKKKSQNDNRKYVNSLQEKIKIYSPCHKQRNIKNKEIWGYSSSTEWTNFCVLDKNYHQHVRTDANERSHTLSNTSDQPFENLSTF